MAVSIGPPAEDNSDGIEIAGDEPAKDEHNPIGNIKMENAKPRKTMMARKTAIQNPMMMDAIRRTRLALKNGEVSGQLTLVLPKSSVLNLPSTLDHDDSSLKSSAIAAARETLCRRFEALHQPRKEDDASYFHAVETERKVTLVTPLPPGYERGGWRCHAKTSTTDCADHVVVECLHPNKPQDESCGKCQGPKPNIRPEYAYLRLLSLGVRRQRREYMRIIKECDHELERCDIAESEATEQIAAFDNMLEQSRTSDVADSSDGNCDDTSAKEKEVDEEDEALMMDVDLVQKGVWQRVNARTLLPTIASRKLKLNHRLASARAELAIMIQASFELAVPHLQRVARRFLVRFRLDSIRKAVLDFARFSAAVEIQRIVRSKLASREAQRLRILRNHHMATRVQSVVRRRSAIKERQRLYRIYINRSATLIQSLHRCHVCKVEAQLLAEEKRRQLAEQEKSRVAFVEKNSVIVIQKHVRRILDKSKCANKRIEMKMNLRLLMYLERFAVDGDMWSFVKSINNDFIRYERTITHTIDREEKMAKTFVEKVRSMRQVHLTPSISITRVTILSFADLVKGYQCKRW